MTDWDPYLFSFHDERAGITERLLGRSRGPGGLDPYRWLAQALPADGPTIDLGCGSGPTARLVRGWVGVDLSRAELDEARRRGRGPVVTASASAVPVRSAAAPAATAVMSLMVVDDPAATLAEARRILRPGGHLALLLPADGSLTMGDRLRYGLVLLVLGRRGLPFPHGEVGRHLPALLHRAGFELVDDERARFTLKLAGAADVDLVIDSWYLPGTTPRRLAVARWIARRALRGDLGLPLRRVLAVTARGSGPGAPRTG